MLYRLINPYHPVTFVAGSDRDAMLVAMVIGSGIFMAADEKGNKIGGMVDFMTTEQRNAEMVKWYPGGMKEFQADFDNRLEEFGDIFASFRICTMEERRRAMDRGIEPTEEMRTGASDIGRRAKKAARNLYANATRKMRD